jgi:hypothetical protein
VLTLAGNGWLAKTVPTPWLTLVAYILVLLGAIIIAEVARRTPLSLPLTGRPYVRRKKPAAS